MKILEKFLKPTQKELFGNLCGLYGKNCGRKNKYIFVEGKAPVMLVAHLDTVHKQPVRDICTTRNGNILMSPQGIGGDDRCGVYALVNIHERSAVKPHLLFTCDEEIGGIGADWFCQDYANQKLPESLREIKAIVEIDRRGSRDAVYYDCANADFEKYITGKGFKTDYGSFSDISYIAPEMGVAAVNLSSGYYNAHTLSEYINRAEIDAVIDKVVGIVSDSNKKDFPKFEYVESYMTKHYYYDWGDYEKKTYAELVPKKMSEEYLELYDSLIFGDYYSVEELEYLRDCYGDGVIREVYDEIFHPLYDCDDGIITTAVAGK